MKPTVFRILPVIVCACLLTQACDFLRKVASRPSGEEVSEAFAAHQQELLESKVRAEIQAAIADSIARADSIEKENRLREEEFLKNEEKYSTALSDMGIKIHDADSRESFPDNAFNAKYGIVIGMFRYPPYAKALYNKALKAGAGAFTVECADKITAVVLGKAGSLEEALAIVNKYKDKEFFPSDAWIVSNSEF